ncbi:hypothetical protein BGX29_000797, partial [Mortierella sp. GBA35]
MTPHQRFRHGSIIKSLAVRKDKTTDDLYSDKKGQEYNPKRIAHYPEDTIDIVNASPAHIAPVSFPDKTSALTAFHNPSHQTQLLPTKISQIQTKIDRSTDNQSAHHIQLMEQLFQMVQRQNKTLTQLAAAKEREETMLAELAAAKERDEEMHKMQQQTIDRLIVAQQRIEAVLVQNYELHEYPIPRLF